MVTALNKAVRLRQALRGRDMRIGASGCARAPGTAAPSEPAPGRSLTARELIRMAQAARRAQAVETKPSGRA